MWHGVSQRRVRQGSRGVVPAWEESIMDDKVNVAKARKEIRAWQIVAQRESGKTIEELQGEVDAIYADEPEVLND